MGGESPGRTVLHPEPAGSRPRCEGVRRLWSRRRARLGVGPDRERERVEAEKGREQREREWLEALAVPVLELDAAAGGLARAHLDAGGFYRRKGEWRRMRESA